MLKVSVLTMNKTPQAFLKLHTSERKDIFLIFKNALKEAENVHAMAGVK